jgi:D-alanyl-D-alanine carboxypeptidase
VLILALMMVLAMTACGSSDTSGEQTDTQESASGIDYMVLVNKLNALPDGWEDALETVSFTDTAGWDVEVEKKAYDAYLGLKEDLEKEGVYVDLDSAYRSVAKQQEIMDEFTEKYGEDYAKKTVAEPGHSEHHTGLALDLYLIIDGENVTENEDMIQYPEVWEKIHTKLAEHGFILRYLDGREHITGYGYEPWHIRYIDDPEAAKKIMDEDITFEEYLGDYRAPEAEIDYGTSSLYTPEELKGAAVRIKCEFAGMEGCELHSLRYAGDECNTRENIDWLNSLSDGADYTKVCEFLCDFHSPKEGGGAWEADQEYTDYQWWLGLNEDGGWDIVTQGY